MTARAALRAGTASDHARVDRLFSIADLGSDVGYRAFLTAQAAAHLPIEAALDAAGAAELIADWPERRRAGLLLCDLAELAIERPALIDPPLLAGDAAIAGAIYVLEGSRLGGALLKRSLASSAPRRFLGAEQPSGAWRKLLAELERILYEPARVGIAIGTAKQIFQRFETAGRCHLEIFRQ